MKKQPIADVPVIQSPHYVATFQLLELRKQLQIIESQIKEVEVRLLNLSKEFAVTKGGTTYIVTCEGTLNSPQINIREIKNEGNV